MMRSLFSGVSGLKVHQTKMDVIGNNIANVNTVGFKSSNVTFTDIFYQTTQSASGPNAETGAGGQNAKQIGLGSTLGVISQNITGQGGAQRTDNPFDMMNYCPSLSCRQGTIVDQRVCGCLDVYVSFGSLQGIFLYFRA